jgi:5-methylcytosine-specific restriction protein A
MPLAPKRPCGKAGCPVLVDGRYCDRHQPRRVRPQYPRESACRRGYDRQWQKERAAHLAANPLCVHCLARGRTTAASIVDHIIPHRGDPVLFRDPANRQSLCKTCHDIKTASEDGGFGNERIST